MVEWVVSPPRPLPPPRPPPHGFVHILRMGVTAGMEPTVRLGTSAYHEGKPCGNRGALTLVDKPRLQMTESSPMGTKVNKTKPL